MIFMMTMLKIQVRKKLWEAWDVYDEYAGHASTDADYCADSDTGYNHADADHDYCAGDDVDIGHLWIACIMDHPYQLCLPKILQSESIWWWGITQIWKCSAERSQKM